MDPRVTYFKKHLEKEGQYNLLLIIELEDLERAKDFKEWPQIMQAYKGKVELGSFASRIEGNFKIN